MTADNPSPLVPRLRFPEFRDGPTWSAPQVAELYGFKRTTTLSRDKLNYETGTIRNIHYGDIHTKFKPLFRVGDEYVPYVNQDASANGFDDDTFCEEGDIVLADASEDLDDVGKAIEVISLDGERVVAGTHTILATRRGSIPVVGFGGQLFQSAAVRAGIKKEAQGAKVYGISAKRISAVLVPIPPTVDEQQKIADCLGSLDDLIAAEGRNLDALRQHKQGMIQQLFPQSGETVPCLRFPKFRDAGEWEEKRLGDLGTLISGLTYSPKDVRDGGLLVLRASNIQNGEIALDDCVYVRRDMNGANLTQPDDILICVRNGSRSLIGKNAIIPKGMPVCTHGAFMTVFRASAPHFARVLLQTTAYQKQVAADLGATINSINRTQLLKYRFTVPKPAEQQRIAACLSAVDTQIGAQARRIVSLKQHKQGLLQQLIPSLEGNEQ